MVTVNFAVHFLNRFPVAEGIDSPPKVMENNVSAHCICILKKYFHFLIKMILIIAIM